MEMGMHDKRKDDGEDQTLQRRRTKRTRQPEEQQTAVQTAVENAPVMQDSTNQQHESRVNSGDDEILEEFHVVLELKDYENMQNTELFCETSNYKLSRLDRDRPILRIDDKVFVGEYQDVVGTYLVMDEMFETKKKEKPPDPDNNNFGLQPARDNDVVENGEMQNSKSEESDDELQRVLSDVKFRALARKKLVFNRLIPETSAARNEEEEEKEPDTENHQKKTPSKKQTKDKKEKKRKKAKKDKKMKKDSKKKKKKKKPKTTDSNAPAPVQPTDVATNLDEHTEHT